MEQEGSVCSPNVFPFERHGLWAYLKMLSVSVLHFPTYGSHCCLLCVANASVNTQSSLNTGYGGSADTKNANDYRESICVHVLTRVWFFTSLEVLISVFSQTLMLLDALKMWTVSVTWKFDFKIENQIRMRNYRCHKNHCFFFLFYKIVQPYNHFRFSQSEIFCLF